MIDSRKFVFCCAFLTLMSSGWLQAQYEIGASPNGHLADHATVYNTSGGVDYFSAGQCSTPNCIDCCCNNCGRYFRVFGGWNWLDSLETEAGPNQALGDAAFNDGWLLGTTIGKYITPRVRRELEFTYRHNSASEFTSPMLPAVPLDGNLRSYSIMGNLIREFGQENQWRWTPYLGFGIGIAFVDGDMTGGGDDYSIDNTVFGYQGFAGINRQISARTRAFVEYRYFGTSVVEIVGPATTTTDRYSSNNLFFGLQFHR